MLTKEVQNSPIVKLLNAYSWIGDVQHRIPDVNTHLLNLNDKFDQELYLCHISQALEFKGDILEKLKPYYLQAIPSVNKNGAYIVRFIFQLSNSFLLILALSAREDAITFFPEFHAPSLNVAYDFVLDNSEYVYEAPATKSLGFGAK